MGTRLAWWMAVAAGIAVAWAEPPPTTGLAENFQAAFSERGDARRSAAIHRIAQDLLLAEIPAALGIAGGAPAGIRKDATTEVYAQWATLDDPRTVLAAAEKIDDPSTRNSAVSKVVNRWARLDGPAALAYAQGFPGGMRRDTVIGNVLATWTQSDPDAVIEAIAKNPAAVPALAVSGIFSRLADSDPERTFALWSIFADRPADRDSTRITGMLGSIFNRFAQENPAKAAAAALALPRPAWRSEALDSLANAWSIMDAPAAFAWFTAEPDRLTAARTASMFGNWARADPAAASAAAAGLDERFSSEAISAVAGWWGTKDPQGAFAWVKALPGTPEREALMLQMLISASESRPQWAADELLARPATPARAGAAAMIAMSWASADPAAAAKWVALLPPGSERQQAAYRLVEGWVRIDPRAAADYVSSLPADQSRREMVMPVAAGWAARDAPAAAQWLLTLRPGEFEFVAGNFVSVWAGHDLDLPLAWAKRLPAGRGRDVALAAVLAGEPGPDPAVAMPLAVTIKEANLRLPAMQALARRWFATDVEAAGRWILASPLTAEEKRQLLAAAKAN